MVSSIFFAAIIVSDDVCKCVDNIIKSVKELRNNTYNLKFFALL